MKKYEKPQLFALRLMANMPICTPCTFDVVGDNANLPVPDPGIDWGKAFGKDECDVVAEGYCKYQLEGLWVFDSQ